MKNQRQVWALVMEPGGAEPLCEWRAGGLHCQKNDPLYSSWMVREFCGKPKSSTSLKANATMAVAVMSTSA